MYAMIINGLHTKKGGMQVRKKERRKPEGLKFTVHLRLTNVEFIRSEVELFCFVCQLYMSLIQYAVIGRYKGLRNETYFFGDANILVSFLLVMKLAKNLQQISRYFFWTIVADDIHEGRVLMIFCFILLQVECENTLLNIGIWIIYILHYAMIYTKLEIYTETNSLRTRN